MVLYRLDAELGWVFWRQSFFWATPTKPKVKPLTLALSQERQAVPGPLVTVSGDGGTVTFTHPITGEKHTLRVVEYENQEVDLSRLAGNGFEYPTQVPPRYFRLVVIFFKERKYAQSRRISGDYNGILNAISRKKIPTEASSCWLFLTSSPIQLFIKLLFVHLCSQLYSRVKI